MKVKQLLEVIYNYNIIVNGIPSKSSCGLLLIEDNSEITEFFLPQNDGTYEMKFSQEDVEAMFIYPERDMVGFFLKREKEDIERRSLIFETP